ncbi:MAG: zeta toxin family protein [Parachlamydiaceae bacterium]
MKKFILILIICVTCQLSAGPTIFAVAGSPAAGKTSFIQAKMKEKGFFPKDVFIHDCDAVMDSLEGYQSDLHTLGPTKAFQNWELPAREKAESLLMEAVREQKDIIYDRSCALPSSYDFLKDLVENHGYTLIMHVLYVTEKNALFRAAEREKETGRHIPENVLLERMLGIATLWPSYLKLAKLCYLYDSNDRSLNLIAMAEDSKLTILDEKGYSAFMNP